MDGHPPYEWESIRIWKSPYFYDGWFESPESLLMDGGYITVTADILKNWDMTGDDEKNSKRSRVDYELQNSHHTIINK